MNHSHACRVFGIGLAVFAAMAAPLQAAPRLALMQPEIDGDLSDASKQEQWHKRLDRLERQVQDGLGDDLYAVVDPQPAADLFAQYAHRAAVYQCVPCALEVAKRLDAERVLSLRVYRMSHLVMNLHAILRDAETGSVRYARFLSFRGDTDEAWRHAADFLIRDMRKIPADKL